MADERSIPLRCLWCDLAAMILVIITTKNFNFFTKQVEKSSKELSTIENEMSTLDEAHKKTAADVESTMLALETTSEQVRNRA